MAEKTEMAWRLLVYVSIDDLFGTVTGMGLTGKYRLGELVHARRLDVAFLCLKFVDLKLKGTDLLPFGFEFEFTVLFLQLFLQEGDLRLFDLFVQLFENEVA
jgi:hypothetical protein